jgi:hypothetical protein
MKKTIIVKNPVAKNLAKLNKKAGAHGKTKKSQRRADTVALQNKLVEELSKKKK